VRRALRAAAVSAGCLAACLGWPERPARAWGTAEHQELGSTSYARACAEVQRLIAAPGAAAAAGARFDLVCGRNVAALARIYGDATAVAGDFVAEPSELISAAGAWRFSSRKHYWRLALENSAHFNPMAVSGWREYHQAALDDAVAAAAHEGLPQLERWGRALRENAFADHFLQDSFAAGHMGFNRRASSAAAAKKFHDHWNARGRVVSDFAGNTWTTYGDGRLNQPTNADGRRHVMDAATASVRDLLLTFVFGHLHPQESLTVWRALPFSLEAPELLADAQALVVGHLTDRGGTPTPLVTAVRPARKDTVLHVNVWSFAPFSGGGVTTAVTAGGELAIPYLPAQASLGAGATLDEPSGKHRAVIEAGLLVPLGLCFDGFISHELELMTSTFFVGGADTVLHVDYEANIELGTWLLSAQLGVVELVPEWKTGWRAGLGVGHTFSAAGGGAF
jgi:hypothetical protein